MAMLAREANPASRTTTGSRVSHSEGASRSRKETVFACFGDAQVEQFRQGGAVRPIDQGPLLRFAHPCVATCGRRSHSVRFTEGFDEPVDDHELGGRDPGRVHPQAPQHRGEPELFPRQERDELGTKLDDVFRFDAFEDDAVDGFLKDGGTGVAGATGELHDASDLLRGRRGEFRLEPVGLPFDEALYGLGNGGFSPSGMSASPSEATTR